MDSYLLIFVFIVIWNVYLKSLILGILVQLFGANIMVQNKSPRECYELWKSGRSVIQNIIFDSFLTPIIIYTLLSLLLKIIF
tara:strand:- start:128 stop:373 length:246 start_codon:yes stop_codon:yes gene_type:complete